MASVLEYLVSQIRGASIYNPDVQAQPHCILWPDRERQWEAVVPRLQDLMPELCVLGPYQPQKRMGPGIWLRCILAGKCMEDMEPAFQDMVNERLDRYKKKGVAPKTPVPVLYLPGVGRQDLRAVDSCPDALKPLAELQYRGALWSQLNAKDWTVLAFLKSDTGGLGLDVAQDAEAKHAMQVSLYKLLDEEIERLEGKRLDKDFFNKLLTGGDPTRDILQWINQGEAFKNARGPIQWHAFVEVTRSQVGFDAEADGQLSAAEKLANHEGPWQPVWQRYCEAPQRYPNIPTLIRRCNPPGDLFADRDGWPQLNDRDEQDLQRSLLRLKDLPPHQARKAVRELDQQHSERRSWVWADLGQCPLARAVGRLGELARICEQPLGVGNIEDMVGIYTTSGWEADRQVMLALAEVNGGEHLEAVSAAIHAIYKPWAEDAARHLQNLVRQQSYPGLKCSELKRHTPIKGEIFLFVDGMRYDIARMLVSALEDAPGMSVESTLKWSALPSVTATAKPAVSPVADLISGSDVSSDFEPSVAATGQSLKGGYHLPKLLKDNGWQVISWAEVGDPAASGWTEFSDIDKLGHERGWKLSKEVERLVQDIKARVQLLLREGWESVRIVTDHGFLMLPGGLPGSALSSALSENTWGRCAALKEGAQSDEVQFSWFWNPAHCFALAEGISCYGRKREFTHGGISLQECLTLELVARSTASTLHLSSVEITDSSWKGLRFTVALEGDGNGLSLDLRARAGDPDSSVAMNVKPFQKGRASVVVEDDSMMSDKAFAVILDSSGNPLAQLETSIGGGANA